MDAVSGMVMGMREVVAEVEEAVVDSMVAVRGEDLSREVVGGIVVEVVVEEAVVAEVEAAIRDEVEEEVVVGEEADAVVIVVWTIMSARATVVVGCSTEEQIERGSLTPRGIAL